ncbi:MAG TPA: hypothetical protein VGJ04_08425 [Pirellulales bacterium]|jgi:hypothetical protein
MRATILFLATMTICSPVVAADPTTVSAFDLIHGETIIHGVLLRPIGTVQEIAGASVEPRNGAKIPNSMLVTESANGAWGAGVDIEIRGVKLERGQDYRFKGYESGEFVKTDDAKLHYKPFFIVTTTFDAVPFEKSVAVEKIKITSAEKQTPLPDTLPKEIANSKADDNDDYGPLSKIFANNIASMQIVSFDSKRFKGENEIADYLRRLLTADKGATWKVQIWSQVTQPMLVVDVQHVIGKSGKWYIAPNGDNAALSVYQDGNGTWWFSRWDDLTASRKM